MLNGESRTLAGVIANKLRKRILAGEIPDGTFLRQDVLAREYEISRIPVREALSQLAAEGLIIQLPHKGSMIPHLSAEDVFDVYDIRAVVEPHLLRQAIPVMTADDLKLSRAALDACETALKSGQLGEWGELNARFHASLYESAQRPHAKSLVQSLLNKCDRYARLSMALAGEASHAHAEHVEIYEFCARGLADQAATALHDHIQNAGASLVAILRARQAARAAGADKPPARDTTDIRAA